MQKMYAHMLDVLLGLSLAGFPALAHSASGVTPRAFPGAEGFGANSLGGRGGKVMFVTNLHDSGPGSFRSACTAKGPRVVIFRVSGIIELDTLLTITEPYLTVAGQTSPGDGICIKNFGCIIEDTHDIIIRYLRFRPGDQKRVEQDALWVHSSRDVIIDHCSTSWGTDETLSVTGSGTTNVTVQWCMITESLNNSVHHKGPHGYGSLFRIDGNLSVHHNLYANHSSRNPRPGCYGDMKRGGMLDFRNNVVYNWGERPGYTAEDKVALNLVANYYKPGPSTSREVRPYAFIIGGKNTNIFVSQNILEGSLTGELDNWKFVDALDTSWTDGARLPVPLWVAEVKTEGAGDAFKRVLNGAGANALKRDPVDERIVREVRDDRGKIIDRPSDVGGWPEYIGGSVPTDTDNDGMTDAWENAHGLNPNSADDANLDVDEDGYTNLEESLNSTDPHRKDIL
jgi:pectate lyase